MAKLLYGECIGRLGAVRLGCSAMLFDEKRQKILLTRRTDNGQWCLPGGGLDPGESVAEACAREMREETGLEVRVGRLLGVCINAVGQAQRNNDSPSSDKVEGRGGLRESPASCDILVAPHQVSSSSHVCSLDFLLGISI